MLSITDLSVSKELDRNAMAAVNGGTSSRWSAYVPPIAFDYQKTIDVVNAVNVDFDFNNLFAYRKTLGTTVVVGGAA